MSRAERIPYEYAVLRVVPRPEKGESMNAGVVLFCPERRFLRAKVHLDEARLVALSSVLSAETVRAHLKSAVVVCEGGTGPLGSLPQRQRFGRVVAPRSGIVRPSEIHTGLTVDPARTLDRLLTLLAQRS